MAAGPSGATAYGYAVLNGRSTTVRTIDTPGTGTDRFRATAMDCADPTFCAAVGTTYTGSTPPAMIEVRYDHARLSVHTVPSPDTDSTGYPVVKSIACPAAGTCAVTGNYETGSQVTRELQLDPMYAQLSHGTWSSHRITLPADAGRQDYHRVVVRALVSCPGVDACVGAGNYFAGDGSATPQQERLFAATGTVPFRNSAALPGDGGLPDTLDCPTTTRCLLASEHGTGTTSNGYPLSAGELTVDSNGTVTQLPLSTGTPNGSVTDVVAACATATFCGVSYSSTTGVGRSTGSTTTAMLATLAG